ncbi:hypothetical protein [Shewanella indica]|uniref:hypothetical protein n=1 Tax=Shewanella indica TaxID=768528 RepID=UPI0030060225
MFLHDTRRSQFTYFLLYKTQEIKFRLEELLIVCQSSRQRFNAGERPTKGDGKLVNFHFSAFASLVQTIKDVMPVITEKTISWTDMSEIRYMDFMHSIRNVITHDGHPVINLWVDGRYYIACNFIRLNQYKKPVEVKAPSEDIETLVLKFTIDLISYLQKVISPLLEEQVLLRPLYGEEFFDNAIKHPAIPEFAKNLYSEADRVEIRKRAGDPATEVLAELAMLITFCQSQK